MSIVFNNKITSIEIAIWFFENLPITEWIIIVINKNFNGISSISYICALQKAHFIRTLFVFHRTLFKVWKLDCILLWINFECFSTRLILHVSKINEIIEIVGIFPCDSFSDGVLIVTRDYANHWLYMINIININGRAITSCKTCEIYLKGPHINEMD